MDAEAYTALLECVGEGSIDKCESVPAGDPAGFLIQPVGGIAVESTGPARQGIIIPSTSTALWLFLVKTIGGVISARGI